MKAPGRVGTMKRGGDVSAAEHRAELESGSDSPERVARSARRAAGSARE